MYGGIAMTNHSQTAREWALDAATDGTWKRESQDITAHTYVADFRGLTYRLDSGKTMGRRTILLTASNGNPNTPPLFREVHEEDVGEATDWRACMYLRTTPTSGLQKSDLVEMVYGTLRERKIISE